jgi:capsular polysaccharide biosynthesis protein
VLSLPEHRVVHGRFGELILLDDWGRNADKRRRYEELLSRFRREMTTRGSERIYVKRGPARAARGRDFLNAAELEAHLITQGFTVVDPDTRSVDQIAVISNDAKLVVGLEDSHLAHAIYPIADNGTLVTIKPSYRVNNVYKDRSDALGLQYAFFVGVLHAGGFTPKSIV